MEPASKLRAIEVRRMSHVTGTLKWAAGNAHAELWRRSVANQGGTAEAFRSHTGMKGLFLCKKVTVRSGAAVKVLNSF